MYRYDIFNFDRIPEKFEFFPKDNFHAAAADTPATTASQASVFMAFSPDASDRLVELDRGRKPRK